MLETGVFRLGSHYEPVELASLTEAERQALPERARETGCAGILRPVAKLGPGSGLTVKVADAETFGLLESLRQPAPLPTEALSSPQAVAAMVLDGILEISSNGSFIAGPEAAREILPAPPPAQPAGAIGALSRRAFDHALRLGVVESSFLAMALYRYNAIPVSPRWLEQMSDIAGYLGLGEGNETGRALAVGWKAVHDKDEEGGWLFWRSRRRRAPAPFKLYLSPAPSDAAEALSTLVKALTEQGPVDFKVGRDAFGLLRPDKIVAYFESLSHLRSVAEQVTTRLAGCPVQGVPFTAELPGDGLLSWGADPRVTESAQLWGGPQSWRLWLTGHIAAAMTTALVLDPAGDPWDFVTVRLSLDGVVPGEWTPSPDWNGEV